jgi:ketosteroid isomerase-like protein
MLTRRWLFLAVLPLASACVATAASSTTDTKAVQAILDSLDTKVQVWLNQGMMDSVVTGYYASDAIVMNPNAPALKGTDAIRSTWTEMLKTMSLRLHFTRSTLIVSDSVASDQGTYTLEIRAKPDTTKVLDSDHGNYVTTFVKKKRSVAGAL